ncbi:DUF2240 domain-containing protein [Halobacteriales archaeon QH_7_69_31]|nr:MAG: DUF2240 domain-containing protein [Halobacteriales archaeon QH_7_69_31]
MSLKRAVAAPFRAAGSREMGESAFVVALSLDRDWFSPDQATRLVDVAGSEGLLDRGDETVRARFDPTAVDVPEGFEPGESILQARSTFERVLDDLVAAGHDKQEAVAAVNRLQSEVAVSVEAAAVLYAHDEGIDVQGHVADALGEG